MIRLRFKAYAVWGMYVLLCMCTCSLLTKFRFNFMSIYHIVLLHSNLFSLILITQGKQSTKNKPGTLRGLRSTSAGATIGS